MVAVYVYLVLEETNVMNVPEDTWVLLLGAALVESALTIGIEL
jgi:hypothetical protein